MRPDPAARPLAFTASLMARWDEAARVIAATPELDATPFQREPWLSSWLATVGAQHKVEPIIVDVRARDSGALALLLILIRRANGNRVVIEFPDLGISDYNGPILGPAAPLAAPAARRLWREVRACLPQADLIRLEKMPAEIGGRPNPLALLKGCRPCISTGHAVTVTGSWEEYIAGLSPQFRRDLRKKARQLERRAAPRFEIVTDLPRLRAAMAALSEQQRRRNVRMGLPYHLDHPEFAAHYDALAERGLGDRCVRVGVLEVDGQIAAVIYGVCEGQSWAIVRQSYDEERFGEYSPGIQLIMAMMRQLHDAGLREFDFTIGDYRYKRQLRANPRPLVDLHEMVTARGLLPVAKARARAALRARPSLHAAARRLMGRTPG